MEHSEFIKLVESAIDKLEAQGKFSRAGHTGKCYYLNAGNCCIVGHMMPDDHTRYEADNSTSGTGIKYLYLKDFAWPKQFTPLQIDVLAELQYYHDCGNDLPATIQAMRDLMDTYHG